MLHSGTLGFCSIDSSQLDIPTQIYVKSVDAGIDPELPLAVAKCESGFNPTAQNKTSSAGGLFQFIDGTWEAFCTGEKYNAKDNMDCAIQMIADGGINHWDASRLCWSAILAQKE